MTAPDTSPGGPKRAIWGLVNDGYALVAKSANLSYDEAFELCRVPDIGDHLTRGEQHPGGDGQVVSGALFPEVSRRK